MKIRLGIVLVLLSLCAGCSTREEGRVSGVGGVGGSNSVEAESKSRENKELTLQEELEAVTDWDEELSSLLDRVNDCDVEWLVKEVTQEQARWESALDYATDTETLKKNRCYVIANKLAQIKNEDFNMTVEPILFVDNQGTDEIYSCMEIDKDRENVEITFYRLGDTKGKLSENKDKKDGKDKSFKFVSDDGSMSGTLTLYGYRGWNGGNFMVDEVKDDSIFTKGDRVTFNVAY